MESTVISFVAGLHIRERMAEATGASQARRRVWPTRGAESAGPILIRPSTDQDRARLERLAALDRRRAPEGSYLLAEVDGELVAAAPLDAAGGPFGDPFRPTREVCELLRLRACQIRRSQAATGRGRRRLIAVREGDPLLGCE